MIHIIEKYLDSLTSSCKGVIFDGFPRTVQQAESLTMMLRRRGMKAVMLDLFVEEDEVFKRLLERGKISGRADDNFATIRQRIKIYHEVTKPVCIYYLQRRNYFLINGNYAIEDTFAQIDTILSLVKPIIETD